MSRCAVERRGGKMQCEGIEEESCDFTFLSWFCQPYFSFLSTVFLMLQNCIFQFLPGIFKMQPEGNEDESCARDFTLHSTFADTSPSQSGKPSAQASPTTALGSGSGLPLSPKEHSSTHLLTWARVDRGLLALRPLAVGGSLGGGDTGHCLFAASVPVYICTTIIKEESLYTLPLRYICARVQLSLLWSTAQCLHPEYPGSWK